MPMKQGGTTLDASLGNMPEGFLFFMRFCLYFGRFGYGIFLQLCVKIH